MDLIIGALLLLVFLVIVPILLASISLQTYLYIAFLIVFLITAYLWVVEKFAPSPHASRSEANYGPSQLYPEEQEKNNNNSDGKVTTTIIFVHGLGANSSTTWMADDGSGSCCWITDLFPDDLRKANLQSSVRLCAFNYNSFWVRNSSLTLRATAVSLLQELQQIQGNLILVGHSFGGIIIKQTLVVSPELKNRVKGVVFLGTPHQGTSFNRYGLLVSYLLLPLDPDIEIMRILAPESATLEGIQRDFEKYFPNTTRKHFFESQKTHRKLFGFIPLLSEFVVSRQSATHGASEMDSVMLETDHRGLNKFKLGSSNYNHVSKALLQMLPQIISISASEFRCHEGDYADADYPGRYLWYREKVGPNGYPAGVRVDPEYASQTVKPIGDTILTCRRTANVLVRHRLSHIAPGLYHVKWIFWFWAGRNIVKSWESLPSCYIPEPNLIPENSVCERYFPAEGQNAFRPDSPYFYPWLLRCSVGSPRDYDQFLHTDVDRRPSMNPLSAPVLLKPGFVEREFECGYWRTMKNIGWAEVRDQVFQVGNDGQIAFVIGNRFVPHWLGGFAFGGVKLEPIT